MILLQHELQYNHQEPTLEQTIVALVQQPVTLERGFRLLMKTYQERLYWHIRGMVQSHDHADEVLQNTFVKIYRGIGNFRGDSQLYTWLYRIATNESITFLQKQNKLKQIASLDDEHTGLNNTLYADTYFDGNKAQALLQKAIALLPDKQRLVFNMRYYQEMPYEEMSSVLHTSVGALKASYHHAAKKVEAFIREHI